MIALKFIRGDLLGDPEMRRRFEREARALDAIIAEGLKRLGAHP
jgi:hypothetical protein